MGEENIKMLVKSEKVSQKKKKIIIWAISILLIIATFAVVAVDYSSYKEGQEFALDTMKLSLKLIGSNWINENDSYAEQCEDIYDMLYWWDYENTADTLAYFMESAGFDRYSYNRVSLSSNIENWFKYTNIVEYFFGYYTIHPLSILSYIAIIFSIIFTISVSREEKKELVVYEDSVLCRISPKKSKELIFEDISNVDFGKNSLKLVGAGTEFKIKNLTNAESIKSMIIEKKKAAQHKSDNSNIGNADELKKYKDLLDSGVISQNEFDAKKKQILGL